MTFVMIQASKSTVTEVLEFDDDFNASTNHDNFQLERICGRIHVGVSHLEEYVFMKKNWLLIVGIVVLAVVALIVVSSATRDQSESTATHTTPTNQSTPAHNHPANTSAAAAETVPAFFKIPPSKSSLAPTLEPEKFTGPTREAYRAVREIPVTIAQLPCYCHCDKGFGHKSLYSCYEDDHAAHCAVCVNEALLALKLEKEQKLTPAQIRETIVAQFSH